MKYILLIFIFLSCQKQEGVTIKPVESVDEIYPVASKPGKGNGNNPPPTPPPVPPIIPTAGTTMIYVDMDGEQVTGYFGNFFAKAPLITQSQKPEIVNYIAAHYAPFNVLVTTDRYRYDTTNIHNKVKIIVTDTAIRSGTGVAIIGSYRRDANEVIGFVFSGRLFNNSKYIGDIVAHEAGHTFSLNHQSVCVNGAVTNHYRDAAIMGMPFYFYPAQWVTGVNNYCLPQNDHQLLVNKLGLR